MKLILSIVAAVGFASIAGALFIAHRVSEPTVVKDPYEEGLHYDDHRHATDPTGGKREARKATAPGPAIGETEVKGLQGGQGSTSLPPAGGGAATGCDLQAGPCKRSLPDGAEVTLSVGPRPVRAMTDVEFTVSVAPASFAAGGAATVALSMPHMYMGETRVALAPAGEGVFRGKGVVVRCSTGRRDWAADVRLERAGAPPITARFPLVVSTE